MKKRVGCSFLLVSMIVFALVAWKLVVIDVLGREVDDGVYIPGGNDMGRVELIAMAAAYLSSRASTPLHRLQSAVNGVA